MSENYGKKIFKILEEEDLDFITGGATVVAKIDNNILPTSRTQKCNCGKFEPLTHGVTLDICDNCKWSQTPSLDSNTTYCSQQYK